MIVSRGGRRSPREEDKSFMALERSVWVDRVALGIRTVVVVFVVVEQYLLNIAYLGHTNVPLKNRLIWWKIS
jgi:hypothetical protein